MAQIGTITVPVTVEVTVRESVPIHMCPPEGRGTMPCCGRTPFERLTHRMTLDPALVTCNRA